jgi:predicted RNA methylase
MMLAETLTNLCKRLEAFQTPTWAVEAVLDVETTTRRILDPCCGLGAIANVCWRAGFDTTAFDFEDWGKHFPGLMTIVGPVSQQDFLEFDEDLFGFTVIMNPPFTLAEKFVDHAHKLGARKVICFQRQAWRESARRRQWWEKNPPARVWVCGSRATCWRFDLVGTELAKRGGSTTSMAWHVWERGHKGAEVTSAIYPEAA